MNGDLISRQAVFEIQAKYAEYIGATKFWQMRDDIKALPSVKQEPRWIPVSERLPEVGQRVLIHTKGKWDDELTYEVAEFRHFITHNEFFWELTENGEYNFEDVIAWMPLPEPYRAESEDKE